MEGMQNVIGLVQQMGIKSHLDPGLSTAIGGSGVTLAEHLQGYQVFADQGQRVDLSVIRQVDDGSGKVVYKHDNLSGTAVLTPVTKIRYRRRHPLERPACDDAERRTLSARADARP